ncbi:amidohydrolase [Stappia sp. 22II-S9-Z10]|nr:amidohydrolase [Stappia sp. 22II-S9-Z10]
MTETFTRIAGATILTADAENTIIEDGDLWLSGGRIAAAGAAGSFTPPEGATVETIDGRDRVAMPGLSNCHTHSYAALLKGTVDTDPLDVFMVQAILAAGARSARDVYVSAQVQALEMLVTGTTACLDHFSHRPRHTPEALDAVMSAYRDAGVRAAVAPMFSDRPFIDTVPLKGELSAELMAELPATPQPADPFFAMMEDALPRWAGDDRVTLMLGIDSPQRCTDALLRRAGEFCAAHGIGNHSHLLEAKTQYAMLDERAPNGWVRYLAECGLAGPKSSFAHFVWGTEDDIAAAAETGVSIVHNPASNLILGSGIQPLLKLVEAGANVAFGSDGLNAGHMSMFEKVRLAALLPRVTEPDPARWMTAETALKMATVNGARALGRGGEAGMLAAGQLADITILDAATVQMAPRGRLAPQIVFYETGASVRDVFVGGERVLKDGKPTRFDGAAILAEGREVAARLARDSKAAVDRIAAFRPGIEAMVKRVLTDGCGPCRLAMLS